MPQPQVVGQLLVTLRASAWVPPRRPCCVSVEQQRVTAHSFDAPLRCVPSTRSLVCAWRVRAWLHSCLASIVRCSLSLCSLAYAPHHPRSLCAPLRDDPLERTAVRALSLCRSAACTRWKGQLCARCSMIWRRRGRYDVGKQRTRRAPKNAPSTPNASLRNVVAAMMWSGGWPGGERAADRASRLRSSMLSDDPHRVSGHPCYRTTRIASPVIHAVGRPASRLRPCCRTTRITSPAML